ncbi:hypothetical protein SAMN05421759_11269 [Roseivivax lentus]|uniref:Helix-turn-helix domain-containing protein n=1 Tax=Roseivivax lentus TaxID=633194 RepID=A0A1N7P3N7_9RHOB|nr:hypothetical protein SAMN05421759_11269 [Roseivivax lentus]
MTERAYHADDGKPAAPRKRRMSARRKQEAVLRILLDDDLDLVSREIGVTAADLSAWRDSFLEAGTASLGSRSTDGRERELKAMSRTLSISAKRRYSLVRVCHHWRVSRATLHRHLSAAPIGAGSRR